MNRKDTEMAARIAAMYLEKHPRPELYLFNLCSSENDSEGSYYKKLSKEDMAVIQRWKPDNEEDISLDEFLAFEDPELYDRLIDNDSIYQLNMIASCDLNDMKKYSPCLIHQYNEGKKDHRIYDSSFPLDDEEFIELLADRIDTQLGVSLNSIVVNRPELGQRIMRHLVDVTWGIPGDNPYPFFVILTEIEIAAKKILDPHTDDLGLFVSDDEDLKNYAIRKEIIPHPLNLYENYDSVNEDFFHVEACFTGRSLKICQEGFKNGLFCYTRDESEFDAEALCEKTGAKNYQELMDIIKEKFNLHTALSDIRSWVASLGL